MLISAINGELLYTWHYCSFKINLKENVDVKTLNMFLIKQDLVYLKFSP